MRRKEKTEERDITKGEDETKDKKEREEEQRVKKKRGEKDTKKRMWKYYTCRLQKQDEAGVEVVRKE